MPALASSPASGRSRSAGGKGGIEVTEEQRTDAAFALRKLAEAWWHLAERVELGDPDVGAAVSQMLGLLSKLTWTRAESGSDGS